MTQHYLEDFGMDVKDKVLLQLFNKKKVKKWDQNVSRAKIFLYGTKTYLEPKFFSIYS